MKKSMKMSGKCLALFLALALVLGLAVCGTVAYLSVKTGEVTNTFTIAEVDSAVEETLSGNTKSDIKVQNTGNIPAYIRAAVVANVLDENGSIVPGAYNLPEPINGWTLGDDGYYYYPMPVESSAYTAVLFPAIENSDNLQITILAEAIQADPIDAVTEAWGYTPNGGAN